MLLRVARVGKQRLSAAADFRLLSLFWQARRVTARRQGRKDKPKLGPPSRLAFPVVLRPIKDATVKRYFYETHDELRAHLRNFVDAYNFARRLKTLKGPL
jgi:hypothetical protein